VTSRGRGAGCGVALPSVLPKYDTHNNINTISFEKGHTAVVQAKDASSDDKAPLADRCPLALDSSVDPSERLNEANTSQSYEVSFYETQKDLDVDDFLSNWISNSQPSARQESGK